jgi:hypothetical protein
VAEVMMSLAVLTISAVGVVAMQKATVIGNAASRNLTVAQNVGATWVERLRADAVQWTNKDSTSIDKTRWLKEVGNDYPTIAGNEGRWFRPAVDSAFGVSPESDVRGYDVFDGKGVGFCTHLRLEQIQPNLIRADVRIVWRRVGTSTNMPGELKGKALCSTDQAYIDALSTEAAREFFHFVNLSSGILRNELE